MTAAEASLTPEAQFHASLGSNEGSVTLLRLTGLWGSQSSDAVGGSVRWSRRSLASSGDPQSKCWPIGVS